MLDLNRISKNISVRPHSLQFYDIKTIKHQLQELFHKNKRTNIIYCFIISLYVTRVNNPKSILSVLLYLDKKFWRRQRSAICVVFAYDRVNIKAVMPTTYNLTSKLIIMLANLQKLKILKRLIVKKIAFSAHKILYLFTQFNDMFCEKKKLRKTLSALQSNTILKIGRKSNVTYKSNDIV